MRQKRVTSILDSADHLVFGSSFKHRGGVRKSRVGKFLAGDCDSLLLRVTVLGFSVYRSIRTSDSNSLCATFLSKGVWVFPGACFASALLLMAEDLEATTSPGFAADGLHILFEWREGNDVGPSTRRSLAELVTDSKILCGPALCGPIACVGNCGWGFAGG